jgi:hypothetical protein
MFLEVLDPPARWQLCDVELRPLALDHARQNPRMLFGLFDCALESLEVRDHRRHLNLVQGACDIVLDNREVIWRYVTAKSRADPLSAVDKNHGDDWGVELGLDLLSVIDHIF